MIGRFSSATIAALVVSASALAAESESGKSTLDSANLGDHRYGPNLSVEQLKGRVVLFDFWGVR